MYMYTLYVYVILCNTICICICNVYVHVPHVYVHVHVYVCMIMCMYPGNYSRRGRRPPLASTRPTLAASPLNRRLERRGGVTLGRPRVATISDIFLCLEFDCCPRGLSKAVVAFCAFLPLCPVVYISAIRTLHSTCMYVSSWLHSNGPTFSCFRISSQSVRPKKRK